MKYLGILVLIFSLNAHSKTLIISDIDDTIKVSHVLDKTDLITNGLKTTAYFKGMRELFEVVLKLNADSEIIYVTNAQELLMKNSHTKFIKNNKFPEGKIFFRNTSADVHKYNTIKSYLDKNPQVDRIIMLGDNAERDIEFYGKIEKEFKTRLMDIRTYIRIAYEVTDRVLPLQETQVGYISPLEILADLTMNAYVDLEDYFKLAITLSKEMVLETKVESSKPQFFPEWLNCGYMKFFIYPQLMTPEIEKAYQKMEKLCQ